MLSPRQLLDLTATPNSVLSAPTLYATGTLPAPFSVGLTAADFRQRMREHGERVRWFQAAESGGAKVFAERALLPAVRVFIHSNTREQNPNEFALLSSGQTTLSFLPDEIEPVRDDRFIAVDRAFTKRETLTPSGASSDALGHKNPVLITAIWAGGIAVAGTRYQIQAARLSWIGAAPTSEITVVYNYLPVYEWLGDGAHQAPLGSDGLRLPGSGPLRLLSAGEE